MEYISHSFFSFCPSVKLNGGRHVQGILRGFDPFMNMVMDDSLEMGPGGQQNSVGMVVSGFPAVKVHINIPILKDSNPDYCRNTQHDNSGGVKYIRLWMHWFDTVLSVVCIDSICFFTADTGVIDKTNHCFVHSLMISPLLDTVRPKWKADVVAALLFLLWKVSSVKKGHIPVKLAWYGYSNNVQGLNADTIEDMVQQ